MAGEDGGEGQETKGEGSLLSLRRGVSRRWQFQQWCAGSPYQVPTQCPTTAAAMIICRAKPRVAFNSSPPYQAERKEGKRCLRPLPRLWQNSVSLSDRPGQVRQVLHPRGDQVRHAMAGTVLWDADHWCPNKAKALFPCYSCQCLEGQERPCGALKALTLFVGGCSPFQKTLTFPGSGWLSAQLIAFISVHS